MATRTELVTSIMEACRELLAPPSIAESCDIELLDRIDSELWDEVESIKEGE